MARSRTRKRYAKKEKVYVPPEVKKEIDLTTQRIKQWTRNELGLLQQNQDTSICIPTSYGYKIGLFKLKTFPNKTCEVWDRNEELVHTFGDKVSAVLYTIYTIKHNFHTAKEILYLDTQINKNYTDTLNLRRRIKSAAASKDYFTVDVKAARLEAAQRKLTECQHRLKALHRTAKIKKVWL